MHTKSWRWNRVWLSRDRWILCRRIEWRRLAGGNSNIGRCSSVGWIQLSHLLAKWWQRSFAFRFFRFLRLFGSRTSTWRIRTGRREVARWRTSTFGAAAAASTFSSFTMSPRFASFILFDIFYRLTSGFRTVFHTQKIDIEFWVLATLGQSVKLSASILMVRVNV